MDYKTIDLILLPFWSPTIPPLGISMLKGYLKHYGKYDVRVDDLNPQTEYRLNYSNYMEIVKGKLSVENQGNVNTIGNKVLMYHSLIYLNKTKTANYINLVNEIFLKHFNSELEETVIKELDGILEEFFSLLSKYLDNRYKNNIPDVLGLSLFNGNLASAMYYSKVFKEKYPDKMVIVGGGIFSDQLYPEGINFKNVMEEMSKYVDKVVIGEGEELLFRLLNGELDNSKFYYTKEDIKNENTKKINLPSPDFSGIQMDNYPQLTSFISRSCPFQCHFCSETVQWGTFRKRDVSEVVTEMIKLNSDYNRSLFLLGDSLLDPVVKEFSAEILSRDAKFYWDGYLRVSKMACSTENTSKWREAGFYRARLGIESGSNRVLNLMNKGIDKEQIRGTLKALASEGIKTTTYWIAGFPGETDQDFQETLDLLEELNEYIFSAECHPFAYFLKGQVLSDQWALEHGVEPLFSEELSKITMLQSWRLKGAGTNSEILKRIHNFNKICEKYKLTSPYNFIEWHHADERWKKLHSKSVPSFLELQK